MLKDLRLSTKLALGFSLPIAAIAIVTVFVYYVSNRASHDAEHVRTEYMVYARLAEQMKLDVLGVQQAFTEIAATQGVDGLAKIGRAKKQREDFASIAAQYEKICKQQERIAELESIKSDFEQYYQFGQKLALAYIDGNSQTGNKMLSEFDGIGTRLNAHIDPFVTAQVQELEIHMGDIIQGGQALKIEVVAVGFFTTILCIAFVLILLRLISPPIASMNEAARKIARGEVEQEITYDAKDEIGSLADSFGKLSAYKIGRVDIEKDEPE